MKVEYPVEVNHSLLELNDDLFNVGLLLRDEMNIFTLEDGPAVPSTYIDDEVD